MKLLIPLSMCLIMNKLFMLFPMLIMSLLWMLFLISKNNMATFTSSIMYLDYLSTTLIMLTIMSTTLIFMSMKKLSSKLLLMSIMLMLILTFTSSKMLMFYMMFEMVLIPTLILITKMGKQPERIQAGLYLIMYTVTASLPLLVGIIMNNYNNNMIFLTTSCYSFKFPLIFMLAFLAKLPMFTLHLWLPKAHVEAPLEGSMILAAVLLKLGGYGLIRFIPLIMKKMNLIPLWLISISLMGALYTSMNCVRQKDLKALIAYSSVSHMGMVLASLMTMNLTALNGSMLMMISHGLSSAALFFLVNIMYTSFHTRNISMFKGTLILSPNLSFWWFMFTAANISAPPSLNLISEILMLMGLISWKMSMMLIISSISLTTTSFSILLYIMMSHNNNPLKMKKIAESKFFMSLFIHLILIIILVMKMEFMIM